MPEIKTWKMSVALSKASSHWMRKGWLLSRYPGKPWNITCLKRRLFFKKRIFEKYIPRTLSYNKFSFKHRKP